jgi:glycosyltransferase involved in cell wall biosynthesis
MATHYDMRFVASIGSSGRYLAYARFPVAVLEVAWHCMAGRAALVQLHTASRGSFLRKWLLSRVVLACRSRYLVHLHGGGFREFWEAASPWLRRRIRAYFTGAAATIVLTEEMSVFARDVVGAAWVGVVPNPVELPGADRVASDSAGVLTVGHLGPDKGTDVLLRAWSGITESCPGASLTLVGDGDLKVLAVQARALGVADSVRFTGWIDRADLERELESCSVFVLPSLVEGVPLSLLEAMAHGLSCVVTPVGGMPDIVVDEECGLVVPVRDSEALSVALTRLLDDSRLRQRLGEAARVKVEREYSLQTCARAMSEVYERLGVGGGVCGAG